MTNAQRGEVVVSVDGKDYTLVVDINALCAIEDAHGVTYDELMGKASKGSLSAIRLITWGALQANHADMTLDDVGRWIGLVGLPTLTQKISALALGATPDAVDTADLGIKPRRPRKARAT
jgi:hypothetical protein